LGFEIWSFGKTSLIGVATSIYSVSDKLPLEITGSFFLLIVLPGELELITGRILFNFSVLFFIFSLFFNYNLVKV